MKTRFVMLISGAVGALILIPIIAVVGLGAYGSSLGGSTTVVGSGGAELKLMPARGIPGSAVRVEGRGLPARARISLTLCRLAGSPDADPLRMRLGGLVASRSGSFGLEIIIPAALVNPNTSGFRITSEWRDRNDSPVGEVSAGFEIEPYPNSMILGVVDAKSGEPLADSILEITDSFGRLLTAGKTGSNGSAVFTGLKPGSLRVAVRRLGYRQGEWSVNADHEGVSTYSLSLDRAPIRRMYVPAATTMSDGLATFAGIDRWTGLRFQHQVPVTPGRRLPSLSDYGRVFFGYLVPVEFDDVSSAEVSELDTPTQLISLGRALTTAGRDVDGYPASISLRHLGRTEIGDVIHSFAASGLISFVSRLLIVDPRSGDVAFDQAVSSAEIPVFPPNQNLVYLIHRFTGRVRTVNLATGEVVTRSERVPAPVVQAVSIAPNGQSAFLLTADGTLHDFSLETLNVGPVLSTNPGSTRIARGPDGKVYLVNPFHSEIVVLDETGSRWETTISLPERSSWAWIDPEGPFIFTAGYTDGKLTIHLFDRNSLAHQQSHTFQNALSSDEAGRIRSSFEGQTLIGGGPAN